MSSQESKLGARILENLPDMSSQRRQAWIDDPTALKETLRRALVGDAGFGTWTYIYPESFSSFEELIEKLESRGVRINTVARSIANKPTICEHARDIELVKVAVSELGFTQPTRFDRVCERARELGLELVPQDAALYVALQDGNKVERGDDVIFAMESVIDLDGHPVVFELDRHPDGGLWLHAGPGELGYELLPVFQLVFCRT